LCPCHTLLSCRLHPLTTQVFPCQTWLVFNVDGHMARTLLGTNHPASACFPKHRNILQESQTKPETNHMARKGVGESEALTGSITRSKDPGNFIWLTLPFQAPKHSYCHHKQPGDTRKAGLRETVTCPTPHMFCFHVQPSAYLHTTLLWASMR
jgi:hypothetical protein